MEFEVKLDKFKESNKVYGHHIVIPEDVSEYFFSKKIKRFIGTINGEHEFPCAMMPKGNGIYFININADIRKKCHLRVGSKMHFHLKADESKYGMPMPEEMGELLKIDDEANEYFHALTKGKQRSLIYLIAKPKNSDTRLNKAIVITEHLKKQKGKLDFKILNQDFKAYNQR
ncbi:MAG TPA: DUF1905 domain-containing protein [Phaeodactylibacter sp.]|nr:DUF1905 domain-containing protein [Phaeodactylibacter sp.]